MSIKLLKQQLATRNLPTHGLKRALLERLQQAMQQKTSQQKTRRSRTTRSQQWPGGVVCTAGVINTKEVTQDFDTSIVLALVAAAAAVRSLLGGQSHRPVPLGFLIFYQFAAIFYVISDAR